MNPLYKTAVSLILAASLFSCEKEIGGSQETAEYTYSFALNDCETGEHSFESLEELCEALQSEKLNNFCAWQSRKQYYVQSGCPGEFGFFFED